MRDALIDFLDREMVDFENSPYGDFCLLESKNPLLAAKPLLNCAVMGAYDLRAMIEDVMRADEADEAEWEQFKTKSDALYYALARIIKTDIGRALLLDCRFENWSCDIVDCGDDASISVAQKLAIIPLPVHSVMALAQQADAKLFFVLSVFESIRRIWHVNVGTPQASLWQFKDLILWNRCLRADLDLMSLIFAFEDRQTGSSDLWRYVLASPLHDMAEQYASMMGIFGDDARQAEAQSDEYFDTLADLYMMWFYDEVRVNQTDMMTLAGFDYALTHGLTSSIIGQNSLVPQDIMALSLYPKGGAPYLEVVASEILYNADYKQFYCSIIEQHASQLEDEIMDQDLSLSNLLVFRDPSLQKLFSIDIMG